MSELLLACVRGDAGERGRPARAAGIGAGDAAGAEAASEPAAGGPKPIPHSIVEPAYQDCTQCHGAGKIKPFPANHEAFPVSACAGCHLPAATATPTAAAPEPTAVTEQ